MDVNASAFAAVNSLMDLKNILIESTEENFMFLGGGSNVLFCDDYKGLIVKNEIKGIELIDETSTHVTLKVYSGELWHDLVVYCVSKNWGGIENLSLIPGTVGAAPMQNIGAYGMELEQVFVSLEALNLETFELETFNHAACEFAYRESVFKRKLKGQYFIYSVSIQLSKLPKINAEYGDIKQVLSEKGIALEQASIKDVSEAVIAIRQSKLPNPQELGNSGSFFKNPSISKAHYLKLKEQFPDIKAFEQIDSYKIPAAWLIEQCGWKGKRVGDTGSHARQALVIVNYGNAKGKEVYAHAQNVIKSVNDKFGILLEPEVNIVL
jgi:UDP-N-acetylmuramate dehydrogenase